MFKANVKYKTVYKTQNKNNKISTNIHEKRSCILNMARTYRQDPDMHTKYQLTWSYMFAQTIL